MWMNEWEIDNAVQRWKGHALLGPAVRTLDSLRNAVNRSSDGWPYWRAPAAAADKLMTLIQDHEKWDREQYQRPRGGAEANAAALKAAYAQLRAFRTRRAKVGGIDFRIFGADGVPGDPEPETPAAPEQHKIRITVSGDRATVVVAGTGSLEPGTYHGTVTKISDRREVAA